MPEPSERLTDGMLALAWSLLGGIGVASRLRHHEDWLVDPEAALMLAALLGEEDARLSDEALAWAVANADLLSRGRMKAILSRWEAVIDARAWNRFATSLRRATGGSWPGARDDNGRAAVRDRRPVPLTGSASRLGLRLRAAVGVGARAEVLAVMLTRAEREFAAGELAVFAQTTKRNTAATLQTLARSGTVRRRQRGNKACYRLTAATPWTELVGPVPAVAVAWVPLLTSLWRVSDWLRGAHPTDARVERIELRTLLERTETDWQASGLALPSRFGLPDGSGHDDLERVVELTEALSRGERTDSSR